MTSGRLDCGTYTTAAGSRVVVSGAHCGIYEIDFDWLEECGCIEASPYILDGVLCWSCDCCGDGSAELSPMRAER